MATLLTADLHPMGNTEIWSRNQISTSLTTTIPITMDEDGCPTKEQPYPQPIKILQKLVPLWEHSIHDWAKILGRGPDGRPYFLDDRELQWANPTLRTPFHQSLQTEHTSGRSSPPRLQNNGPSSRGAFVLPPCGTSPSPQDGKIFRKTTGEHSETPHPR